MLIRLRLLGTIKEASGVSEEEIQIPGDSSVYTALKLLIAKYGDSFSKVLFDPVIDRPTNTLIIVNGVEIDNLNGLCTPLKEGDELTLLSVTHGG
jgi:MoaD family protein